MTQPITAGDRVTIATAARPCLGCGEPTKVRVDGLPYTWSCFLTKNPQPAAGARAPKMSLRFLEDLHDTYAPKKRIEGRMRAPWWQPPAPEITDRVQTAGWSWRLPPVPGAGVLAVLDRTAAYLSAAASIDVTHGCLVHTPEETTYQGLPGFYKVLWHPWTETGIEHPLGGWSWQDTDVHEMWVCHPRAQLLQRLADQGRYPDGFILDSYTCGRDDAGKARSVRLDKWAGHVQTTRKMIIEKYGRYDTSQSDGQTIEYKAVKTNFSQAIALMTGRWEPGKGRTFNPTVRVRRPDWGMSIGELSATTLWGWCDDIRQVVEDAGRPELAPVGMRNVDELLVPYEALELITTTPRSGGRKPLRIDPEGIELGTFKVKVMQ